MRLIPGINEDLATASFLLDELPESPSLAVEHNLLCARASKDCVRLQLLRNDGEIIAESPSSAIDDTAEVSLQARLLLIFGDPFKPSWAGTQRTGILSIEGGRVIYANVLDGDWTPKKCSVEAGGALSFSVSCVSNFFRTMLYVDSLVNANESRFVIKENGQPSISFSFGEIKHKRVLAWQRGSKSLVVSLVGGEPNKGYRGLKGKPTTIAFDISSLPEGSANDVYYARAFTADGAWSDSIPFVVKARDSNTVDMPCLDAVTGTIVPVCLRKEEALMLGYDFSENKIADAFLVRDSSMRGAHTVLPSGAFILGGKTGSHLAGPSLCVPTPENIKDPSRTVTDEKPALSLDGSDAFSLPSCIPNGCFNVDIDLNVPEFDVERTILADRRFGAQGSFCLRVLGDGRIKASRKNSSNLWDDLLSNIPIPSGKWTNVRVAYDLKTMSVYIDGQKAGEIPSAPVSLSYARNSYHLFGREIGSSNYVGESGPSKPFNGKVGGLRVYCVPQPQSTCKQESP